VRIRRRGKPVAQITGIKSRRKWIDPMALRALTEAIPVQRETARSFVRRMRDQERN
jgi:antitoxin (DNA-binding transcriptional repressor) of toxin-antitoxin stability system